MRGKGGKRGGDEDGGREKEIKREKTKARKTEAVKNFSNSQEIILRFACVLFNSASTVL